MSHITDALAIVTCSSAIAAVEGCTAPTRAIRSGSVLITLADALDTRTTASTVLRTALERAIRGKRASPALIAHTCAIPAVSMSTAAVLANS